MPLIFWDVLGDFFPREQKGFGREERAQKGSTQNLRNCHESETSPPPPLRLGAENGFQLGVLELLNYI